LRHSVVTIIVKAQTVTLVPQSRSMPSREEITACNPYFFIFLVKGMISESRKGKHV